MNQARLVMSARYQIDSERNPQEYIEKMIAEGTMERLIQYELFTSLQQWLVVNIMDTGG